MGTDFGVSKMHPTPPLTTLEDLPEQLNQTGWAVLDADALCRLTATSPTHFEGWHALWADLPPDLHLRDGGNYRSRRHGCFVVEQGRCRLVAQRAHWQPVEYNALHGGIARQFEPLPESLTADPTWSRLLLALADLARQMRGADTWFVEAHPFRIDASAGIGRPTPEGAHRDGVDLVAVIYLGRSNVKGGETRVFDAQGTRGVRFVLHQPWSVLLLDDERVIHESTPIQPVDPQLPSWRDTLVLTLRQGGFQGPQGE